MSSVEQGSVSPEDLKLGKPDKKEEKVDAIDEEKWKQVLVGRLDRAKIKIEGIEDMNSEEITKLITQILLGPRTKTRERLRKI